MTKTAAKKANEMDLKSEITGVERITIEHGATAALIKCDKQAALERCYFAYNGCDEDANTQFKLHEEYGTARVEFIADEPAGLSCGPWVIYVGIEHDGVVVMKQEGYYGDECDSIDLENEWIDVLAIVRNFFALPRSQDWSYERFL